jgi:hypothetical protein
MFLLEITPPAFCITRFCTQLIGVVQAWPEYLFLHLNICYPKLSAFKKSALPDFLFPEFILRIVTPYSLI